ncbi:MAG: hypothetical protein OQK76_01350 [Gammaproteobacteria bacterium]|nr:hypothetical protein [Gammaproteobacteria bacterium]MCW8909241.1 hypothetical protein [Gammaproteobacteria bacterium]MCW9003823.1 hypothetical protein [Gammaproteobacteria bacterium]MCW9057153.1 hypothetical protein [Gammaproteobacteria bacterium]
MNSSINFSTFLHSAHKSNQKIKRKNIFITDINNADAVDTEENAMNNTSLSKDPNLDIINPQ